MDWFPAKLYRLQNEHDGNELDQHRSGSHRKALENSCHALPSSGSSFPCSNVLSCAVVPETRLYTKELTWLNRRALLPYRDYMAHCCASSLQIYLTMHLAHDQVLQLSQIWYRELSVSDASIRKCGGESIP